jgi:hypothetical protein
VTPNGMCSFAVRTVPLPSNVTNFLETNSASIIKLLDELRTLQGVSRCAVRATVELSRLQFSFKGSKGTLSPISKFLSVEGAVLHFCLLGTGPKPFSTFVQESFGC